MKVSDIEVTAKRIDCEEVVQGHYFKAPLTAENWGCDHFSSGKTRHCIVTDTASVYEIDATTIKLVNSQPNIEEISISKKLKSCPFCKGKPIIKSDDHEYPTSYSLIPCCTLINFKYFKTKEEAIKAWNTRTIDKTNILDGNGCVKDTLGVELCSCQKCWSTETKIDKNRTMINWEDWTPSPVMTRVATQFEKLQTEINEQCDKDMKKYPQEMSEIWLMLPIEKILDFMVNVRKIQKNYQKGGKFYQKSNEPLMAKFEKVKPTLFWEYNTEVTVSMNEQMKQSIIINLAHCNSSE